MEQQTLDALNQLLITMQNVGIGLVLALIVGLMVVAFIIVNRRQSKSEASTSEQFRQVIVMLADSLKREDSETAKAMMPLIEIVGMAKISLEQNTQAFIQQTSYRAQVLDATKDLGRLQTETNTRLATMNDGLDKWPNSIMTALDRVDMNILNVVNGFGGLDENIRRILKMVEHNPEDHRHVLEALTSLAEAQQKIFTLIDSRLPASAKVDTPTLRTALPAAPPHDLIEFKREVNNIIPLPPTDEPDESA